MSAASVREAFLSTQDLTRQLFTVLRAMRDTGRRGDVVIDFADIALGLLGDLDSVTESGMTNFQRVQEAQQDPFEGIPGEPASSSEFQLNDFERAGQNFSDFSHHLVALAEACEVMAFAMSKHGELVAVQAREAATCAR